MLDIKKIKDLYYAVASTQEMFSDSEKTYYKMFVTLERIEETVTILNNIELTGRWNEEAVKFVLWVNYAHLLVKGIEDIAKGFTIDIEKTWDIFKRYHNIEEKDDYDFFGFIRAIVLPHALSLDKPQQRVFTNGKTAYCSHVKWDIDNKVCIVYYNADINDDLHTYNLSMEDCKNYVAKFYEQIEKCISVIPKRKNNCKNKMKQKLLNEPYNKDMNIKEKCKFLKELTVKYGDLDDKSGVSYTMSILNRCEKMLNGRYYGKNKLLFARYKKALDRAFDEYYKYMCEYRTNEKLLDFVLSPIINHSSKETKVFKGKEYFINKIITECENFDFYFERYEYNEFFEELKLCMKPYAYVSKRTTMMHFCYLAIMVAFVVKLDDTDEYKNLFVNI